MFDFEFVRFQIVFYFEFCSVLNFVHILKSKLNGKKKKSVPLLDQVWSIPGPRTLSGAMLRSRLMRRIGAPLVPLFRAVFPRVRAPGARIGGRWVYTLQGKGLLPSFLSTAGAPKPAGVNGPVISGYCRCTTLCAGGSSSTAGAPALLRRQRACSTGAVARAPAVGLPALARAMCADRRACRCADSNIRKFNFGTFSSILQFIFAYLYSSI